MITKEAVRQACKSQRAALSIADCESWAPKLCHEIVQLPQYEQAQSIMAYLAMPKEANLDDVIEHPLKQLNLLQFSHYFQSQYFLAVLLLFQL